MSVFKKGTLDPTGDSSPASVIKPDSSSQRQLFDSMQIRDSWASAARQAADLVLRGRSRYETVAKQSGVPWYMIGCIHLLEGSCNFGTHLHNGDSLKARTVHVPAGRPTKGNPPFTWEVSALDALSYDGVRPPLDTIGQQFDRLERFNGTGYRSHGINTPYLWSGTNHYSAGKYVSDGHWSSTAVSEQVGAACIYKIFQDRGLIAL